MQIQDKVIVVTGGASGLGRATAEYLVRKRGAKVAIFDLNTAAGHATQEELGGDQSLFVEVDVTDPNAVRNGVAQASEKFGAIHGCINAAGVPAPCKVLDRDRQATPLDQFAQVIKVNLIGLFNVMSHCAEQMAKNEPDDQGERGVIVNISSGAAYEGQIGQCAYGASKSGILGLNMPAARELGQLGIRVNAIAPGLFETPMVDSLGEKVKASLVDMVEAPKRMGRMDEFAHCCTFLIENGYMNGRTIRLDAATILKAR
jgi:NAD(P)-dependent dehydrogenase (short-subunit alcohol dehydrogenase family)